MNHEPNTEQWRWDDLVIHDADAKHPKMLMKVIGFTRDGLVKTQYLDPRGIGTGGRTRKVWKNDFKFLHNPNRFGIPTKGISPFIDRTRFEDFCNEWDMMQRWNKKYQIGQRVRTTSGDGGFETVTGGTAQMWGATARVWLVHTENHRGGNWWLKFVEPVIETELERA